MSDFKPISKTATPLQKVLVHHALLMRELQACQNVLHSLGIFGQVTPSYALDAKEALEASPVEAIAELEAIGTLELQLEASNRKLKSDTILESLDYISASQSPDRNYMMGWNDAMDRMKAHAKAIELGKRKR